MKLPMLWSSWRSPIIDTPFKQRTVKNSRSRQSHRRYDKTVDLYEGAGNRALSKLAMARRAFSSFWLRDDPSDKRKICLECIQVAGDSAHMLDGQSQVRYVARAHLDLFTYYRETLNFATDQAALLDYFERGMETGWKASEEFEQLDDLKGLLESFHAIVLLFAWADWILEPSQYEVLAKKMGNKRADMAELARKIGTLYAQCLAAEISELLAGDLEGDMARDVSVGPRVLSWPEA